MQFVPDLCGKEFTERRGRIRLEISLTHKDKDKETGAPQEIGGGGGSLGVVAPVSVGTMDGAAGETTCNIRGTVAAQ